MKNRTILVLSVSFALLISGAMVFGHAQTTPVSNPGAEIREATTKWLATVRSTRSSGMEQTDRRCCPYSANCSIGKRYPRQFWFQKTEDSSNGLRLRIVLD